jgi:hypothetical protein
LAKVGYLFDQELSGYWFAVDEFEWPSAYSDRNIFPVALPSECEQPAQAHVSERAHKVGEDFDELYTFAVSHQDSDIPRPGYKVS